MNTHNLSLECAIDYLKEKHKREALIGKDDFDVIIKRDLKNIIQVYDFTLE